MCPKNEALSTLLWASKDINHPMDKIKTPKEVGTLQKF
jgi:hypothetical protein